MRNDEFVEKGDSSCNEELKDYSTFIYVDDDAPNTQNEWTSLATSSHQTRNDGMQIKTTK